MYFIVLHDYTQALVIPKSITKVQQTIQNQDGTTSAVKVSFTCDDIYVEPTPTPTPVVCIPTFRKLRKHLLVRKIKAETLQEIFIDEILKVTELGLDISNTLPAPNSVLRVAIPSQNFVGNIAIYNQDQSIIYTLYVFVTWRCLLSW